MPAQPKWTILLTLLVSCSVCLTILYVVMDWIMNYAGSLCNRSSFTETQVLNLIRLFMPQQSEDFVGADDNTETY